MTTDPLLAPVHGGRIRAYLRHRFAPQPTAVLIPADAEPGPLTLRTVLASPALFRVHTHERRTEFTCPLPAGTTGLGRTAHIALTWWAHNPWAVVRRRIHDGKVHIRRDVAQRLDKASASRAQAATLDLENALFAAMSANVQLDELGLSYGHVVLRVVSQSPSEARQSQRDALRWDIAMEEDRQQLDRIRLGYHQQLIRQGPEALLAYWLQQRPQDIHLILDQVRNHIPEPEAPPAGEELDRHLLELLTKMTGFERQRVRELVGFAVADRSGPDTRRALIDLGLIDEDSLATTGRPEEEPRCF